MLNISKYYFAKHVKQLKLHIAETSALKIKKYLEHAHFWFTKMMQANIKMKDADKQVRGKAKKLYKAYKQRHENALKLVKEAKPYPKYIAIADRLGISERFLRN